jgi:cytochrome bd-type quinol oxidase subunit 2
MMSMDQQPTANTPSSKGKSLASVAALATSLLASSCCLPLLPFVAGAGTAGSSAFFVKLRPFLIAASLGFVALGFYQAWHAKQCRRRPTIVSTIPLWFSAIVVLVFTFFPQAMANFIADLTTR